MSGVVDYLNGVNDLYKSGKTEYVWNVLQNNCSHLTHNALAAAGVWDHFPTNKFVLFAAFDFPVPKNEFINQLERTNDLPLANLLDLYACLLYTSDAADDLLCVDLGGRRIIKKKKKK